MKRIFQKLFRFFGRRKRRFVIIGLGEFDCGPADLSTNKKYMEGFGE